MTKGPVASEEMYGYFSDLARQKDECYAVAGEARKLGIDPEPFVEVPQAEDLASRVEELLKDYQVEGVAEDIRRLTAENRNRELVSLLVAKEVARRPADSVEMALDRAIRVGLAVLTEGILVAPLEGIADVKVKRNDDGTEFVDLMLAGPIRAAGGTAQAMSVLIADVVRRELNLGHYQPTEQEIARFDEEISLYRQQQHLQYSPTSQEIDLIVRNCPVMIDGEGTEQVEISGFRDLPRIETNRVRGGACLVIAEGLCQKASKIKKHVDTLKIDGWDFITKYLELHAPSKDEDKVEEENAKKTIYPEETYLADIIAGRPVFGYPSREGGFRLRYGRARTTGLAALAFSPATMYAMEEFMAIGTQMKIERPGKGCVVTPCDEIEGPTVVLNNGDMIYCHTKKEVEEVRSRIVRIVDNGEVLVPFGEFCENNHVLVPPGYCIEWHRQEILIKGELPEDWELPTYKRAKEMSVELGVPLHPKYNLFWSDMKLDELVRIRNHLIEHGSYNEGNISVPAEGDIKTLFENLGALHRFRNGRIGIFKRYSDVILDCLNLEPKEGNIVEKGKFDGEDSLDAVSKALGITVKNRGGTRIGMRMGRPEKAYQREMAPTSHGLFPVGSGLDSNRDLITAIEKSKRSAGNVRGSNSDVYLQVGSRKCTSCGKITWRSWCRDCKSHTVSEINPRMNQFGGVSPMPVNLDAELSAACERLGENKPKAVRCVQTLRSKLKVPEALEKGILRAKHDLFVNKDGTVRYDMTDIPLTHFRPREIELTVEKAIELGYTHDWNGEPLTDPDQICELKVQDIIPPMECGDFMTKVAQFVDDELEGLYKLRPYYNVTDRSGLIGEIAFGLAPHTSGGILCRIIGYTSARGCFGHPFFHAAKRRNCDGDEDCIILALDALLNFSFSFLPSSRGGMMDAPLVLTTRLDPNEIDKEAHNVDCLREYPLELYHAASELANTKEVEKIMDLVGNRVGTPAQYEGLGFTHDTSDIAEGPRFSAYITYETMAEKMDAQLSLCEKIRAVDERDVATKIINKHFLPDMIGNLRSFSAQRFRCSKCGERYRRIPITGRCTKCDTPVIMTVYKGSVMKYLEISKEVSENYNVNDYTKNRIELLEMSMKSVFDNDKVKKCTLQDFF
ncbi:MAG: DNA polymerase II large subunit [Candidatus Methanomethylophilaceae archaeon]|jgi:DNA polymerase II large subunit